MATKKTADDYENIFSKMLFQHNNDTVPFLKSIGSRTLRVSCLRVQQDLGRLEEDGQCWNTNHYLNEYLLLNKFIIQFLNQEEYKNCIDLILNRNKDNVIIGAFALYNMIETKKKEIIIKINS